MVYTSILRLGATKRIPMIRFRKGSPAASESHHHSDAVSSSAAAASSGTSHTVSSNAIEDWELPARYRRKGIDKAEMEYINRGGPE